MTHPYVRSFSRPWLGFAFIVVWMCSPLFGADEAAREASAATAGPPTSAEWVEMLGDNDPAVRVKGVQGLLKSGDFDCLAELSKRLMDDVSEVRGLAEQAMWQVWFRSGNGQADAMLHASMELIGAHEFNEAAKKLAAALAIVPDFAEAYNQRAIIHYHRRQFGKSIKDCKEVIKRNPYHFGALSGMGQCYQHLGNTGQAIKAYERALRINPNMEGVRRTLIQLLRADGKAIQA